MIKLKSYNEICIIYRLHPFDLDSFIRKLAVEGKSQQSGSTSTIRVKELKNKELKKEKALV